MNDSKYSDFDLFALENHELQRIFYNLFNIFIATVLPRLRFPPQNVRGLLPVVGSL